MTNPVQHQVDAYNDRDLDTFMEAYAPDIRVENGTGATMMEGAEELRAFYGTLFENSPDLHCEVVDRTQVGDWTIDEEQIQGLNAEGLPEEAHAVAAYKVNGGEITFVRMFM